MKILLIQLRRIGDVLLTTPAVREIRRAWPDAVIDFLVEAPGAEALTNNPNINSVLVYSSGEYWQWLKRVRASQYDIVVDFLNNPRSAQIVLASRAKVRAGFRVGIWNWVYNRKAERPRTPVYTPLVKFKLLEVLDIKLSGSPLPEMFLDDRDISFAGSWLNSQDINLNEPIVGILPTHRRPVRKWRADGFAGTGEWAIKELGASVIVFCGPGEENESRNVAEIMAAKLSPSQQKRIYISPPASLKGFAALLKRCTFVITNDSGPMHVAVSVGVPTVTIYGPTTPVSWNPSLVPVNFLQPSLSAKHRIVQARGLACLGCGRNECPYKHECMEWVSADQTIEACKEVVG